METAVRQNQNHGKDDGDEGQKREGEQGLESGMGGEGGDGGEGGGGEGLGNEGSIVVGDKFGGNLVGAVAEMGESV